MNVIISNKYQTLLATLDIDVIKVINGVFTSEDIINQFSNFFYNKMIIDITAIGDYQNINVIRNLTMNLDMSKVIFLLDDSVEVNAPKYLSQLVSMGIYNFTSKPDIVKFLIDNPNQYKDVANYQQLSTEGSTDAPAPAPNNIFNSNAAQPQQKMVQQRIIGLKNVTDHSGSTTLAYIMSKHLSKLYKVKTVEVDSYDFTNLNDKTLESIASNTLSNYITSNIDSEIIIVDLNKYEGEGICSEILYLIEPGMIKLNKLIKQDEKIFDKLKGKKIILNRSVLTAKDVSDFEKESGSKIYFNLPNLDDKLEHDKTVVGFLIALGFARFSENDNKGGLFNMF